MKISSQSSTANKFIKTNHETELRFCLLSNNRNSHINNKKYWQKREFRMKKREFSSYYYHYCFQDISNLRQIIILRATAGNPWIIYRELTKSNKITWKRRLFFWYFQCSVILLLIIIISFMSVWDFCLWHILCVFLFNYKRQYHQPWISCEFYKNLCTISSIRYNNRCGG